MARAWRIKKGDQVMVITGKDKGKKGEVIEVLRQEERVVVRGVNIKKRHQRPTAASAGGVIEKEGSIHVSNVLHIDPKSSKPTRVGIKFLDKDRKVRVSKKSGEVIDN